jgi:selenide,water dikinase
VRDAELKYGMAVVGEADRERLLTNAGARPGDRLVLTKPLGTGALISAFKFDRIGAAEFEPVIAEMERLNAEAARLALAHGARAATDVTGFGMAGHALGMARASGAGLRLVFARLPVHEGFFRLAAEGVSTRCTVANAGHAGDGLADHAGLSPAQRELLFDPQTSGGLLVALPPDGAAPLLTALAASGHRAAEIGEVVAGPAQVEVV